jgi:hypothetical protein
MAVPAVHTKLTRVQTVIKGNRLDRRIADPQVGGRGVIRNASRRDAAQDAKEDEDLQRQSVRGFRKYLGHD